MADRTVLSGMQDNLSDNVWFNYTCHSLSICTLMLCPLIVHVYSCFPENEAPAVFLYSVMLVGSDDCEQVNGPNPPLHCTGVLSGPVHCPPPPPVPPASTQWSGLSAVRAKSLITVYSGRQ